MTGVIFKCKQMDTDADRLRYRFAPAPIRLNPFLSVESINR
jgi:hypothetical protein